MSSLCLSHLTHYYGSVRALEDVSLHVTAGELLVLVGPSGCGKTTLLRLIAGLEQPTTGDILLEERPLSTMPPWRREVAFLFQHPALQPHLTVEENLLFPFRMRGQTAGEPQRRQAWQLLDQLELGDLAQRYPDQLSGGQQQRAALARALITPARLLLLDEPFSHLDFHLAQRLRPWLRQWQRQQRRTTLLVTHDPVEARVLADWVAVLGAGRLHQTGTAQDLAQRPATTFVAGFFPWPPLNLIEGEILPGEGGLLFAGPGLKFRLPDCTMKERLSNRQRVIVGLAPTDVCLEPPAGAGESILEMEVLHLEQHALATLVTLAAGALQLVAVLPVQQARSSLVTLLPGACLKVWLQPRLLHLFDPHTGQALT